MFHVSVLCAEFRNHFKRIYIEIPVSCNVDSCNHGVVQCLLYIIIIRGISCDGCHSLPKHHHTDGRTGFRIIGAVWKVIVSSKSFTETAASDSSCDVHPAVCHVIPDSLACILKLLVIIFPGKICHCGAHVHLPDCMSYCLVLFYRRLVSL